MGVTCSGLPLALKDNNQNILIEFYGLNTHTLRLVLWCSLINLFSLEIIHNLYVEYLKIVNCTKLISSQTCNVSLLLEMRALSLHNLLPDLFSVAHFIPRLLCCSSASLTLSARLSVCLYHISRARSHTIHTEACYVTLLSNQQALEVIKQVNYSSSEQTNQETQHT